MPRKASVVVQFTVSVILIIGTIVVYRQNVFAQNRLVDIHGGWSGTLAITLLTVSFHAIKAAIAILREKFENRIIV